MCYYRDQVGARNKYSGIPQKNWHFEFRYYEIWRNLAAIGDDISNSLVVEIAKVLTAKSRNQ